MCLVRHDDLGYSKWCESFSGIRVGAFFHTQKKALEVPDCIAGIQKDFLCSPLWVLCSYVQDQPNKLSFAHQSLRGHGEDFESGVRSGLVSQVQSLRAATVGNARLVRRWGSEPITLEYVCEHEGEGQGRGVQATLGEISKGESMRHGPKEKVPSLLSSIFS